jgi:hypothetical protein
MLSGTFALAAYATHTLLRSSGRDDPQIRGAASGLLIGLALLAHGSVVFGLVPLFIAFVVGTRSGRIRAVLAVVVVAAVVVAPWLLWQRLEDPPGNALIKYALAGTYGFGEETKGLPATVREAYSRLSSAEWLLLRWQAILTLFGAFRPEAVAWLWSQPMDYWGRLRLADFAFVFPSLRLGNLGWVVVAAAAIRACRVSVAAPESHFVRWVLIGVAGIALNALVLWSAHVNWTESYLSLLLMVTGLYSALLVKGQVLRRLLLSAQFGYFAVVWWWSPLATRPWRHDHLIGWLLSVLALWLLLQSGNETGRQCERSSDCTPPREQCGHGSSAFGRPQGGSQ